MSKTVMLIHGAWLTPASFDQFRSRFEAQGFKVVTPTWPFMDRPIAELRRSPRPEFAKVGIKELVDHYDKKVRELPEPPILVGHSFGGLIVQMLLDRGLGAAGVGIDPGPPRGVIAHPRAVISSLPVFLTWAAWKKVVTMSQKSFDTTFAQTLSPVQLRAAYERHVVPTPGRIFFQAALGFANGVNFKNPDRAPLLLIAGEKDRTVPLPMVVSNYRKHRRSPVTTAYKSFPNRSHWLINEPGWEEIADYVIEWVRSNDRTKSPARRPKVTTKV